MLVLPIGEFAYRGRVLALALALAITGALIMAGTRAVSAQPSEGTTAAAAGADDGAEPALAAEEVEALLAPIALYPDPMLIVILQAATQPLQVVQADRFLTRYAKDSSLQPDPEWDPSIIGLLNYPEVVSSMNEYVDWTEAVGEAVLTQLDDVQASIQDIRRASYTTGILKSNEQQNVIVEDDVIRIMPADPETLAIPKYDPVALLAAIEPAEGAEIIEDDLTIATGEEAAAAPESEPAAEPATAAVSAEAAYGSAPAEPGYYAPYAPTAAPMPPVAYGNSGSSFWGSAATFAGGAAVGGLLGYAIFDDDDDNDGGDRDDRRITIEDSTIIAGNDRFDNRRIEKELRDRRRDRDRIADRNRDRDRVGRGDRRQPRGIAPAKVSGGGGVARSKPRKDVRLPGAGGKTAKAVTQQRGSAKKAATSAKRSGSGLAATKMSRGQVRKEAHRGASSRGVAKQGRSKEKHASASGSKRKSNAMASKSRGGGLTNVKNGKSAKRDSNRGKRSKGGGGKKKRG